MSKQIEKPCYKVVQNPTIIMKITLDSFVPLSKHDFLIPKFRLFSNQSQLGEPTNNLYTETGNPVTPLDSGSQVKSNCSQITYLLVLNFYLFGVYPK